MNPIEPAWSKLKGKLRDSAPRTIEALDAALPDALASITLTTPALGSNIGDIVQPDPQSALVVLHVQLAQDRPPEPVLVAKELGEFLRRVADDELGIPRQ